jgi:hypothetical protein
VFLRLDLAYPMTVRPEHFSNTGTARDCSFLPSGSGTQWVVVAGCSTDGTLIVRFDPPTITASTAVPVVLASPAPTPVTITRTRATARRLATLANVTVPAGSQLRMTVPRRSARVCRVSGSRVTVTGTGRCTIVLTVTPRRGRAYKERIHITRNP